MDADLERTRAAETGWIHLGHIDQDGVTTGGKMAIGSITVELTDEFATLCGTRKLTGGRAVDGGVLFDLPDDRRVFITYAGLGLGEPSA